MTPLRSFATLVTSAAAALLVTQPAVAEPRPVTSGALRWSQFNVYDTSAPAGTDRTWLGYLTAIGPPFTNGSATVTAPATGDSVTPQSPRGRDQAYTHAFPVAAGGSYDPQTGTGDLEFAGTLTFTSAAHGFTITVSNPLVVLRADSAQVFASGSGASGSGQSSSAGTPYDRTKPVLDLAVTGAATTTGPDGTTTITGLAPAIATADMVWPGGSYPAGAGPDRTPNTFGTFALEVGTAASAPPPAAPAPEPVHQPAPAPSATPAPGTTTPDATGVASPKVRCRPTRTRRGAARTTCSVTVDRRVRRVVVTYRGRRVAAARTTGGRATIELPRLRRSLAFVALDGAGRRLARRVQTVGG